MYGGDLRELDEKIEEEREAQRDANFGSLPPKTNWQ